MQYKPLNKIVFRYEILRSGGVYAELDAVEAPEILCEADSDLVLSIRGKFLVQDGIDLYRDRLRPVAEVNGKEYNLGVYVITTASRSENTQDGRRIEEIEAYSVLYLAQRKKIETRLSIDAGTNYITQIVALLSLAGITDISSDATEYTMATAREDWDIGTPVLEIVNKLLSEISYRPAYVNLDGQVQLKKYEAPSLSSVSHTYAEGEESVIMTEFRITDDRFDKANVFRVTCDSPDREEILAATAENSSSSSPYSTVNIGRILYTEQMDSVPSHEALQERADMLRDQSMQSEEEIEFYTAFAPDHNPHDTVALHVGGASGIFAETGWRITASAGATMTHKARRIIS